jgi:hypothetical protein
MKTESVLSFWERPRWPFRRWRKTSQLPAPPPVEKELAARASNVTEVTLGKNMLAFAAKFMNGKDKDEAATRQLIEGLDGIYVREYEFDKEGQFSMEEIEQLRKYFETSEWSPIVRERDRKTGESTDVMVKLVNGESHGMFILTVEPKELTIVLILGPIRMEDLGKLKGMAGWGAWLTGRHAAQPARQGRGQRQGKGQEGRRQRMRRLWLIPIVLCCPAVPGGGAGRQRRGRI